MKRILILTTAVAATATSAFAAGPTQTQPDPVVAAPVPAPVPQEPLSDFTGFSLGGQVGYGNIETEDPDLDGDGGLYGLRSYYDYDMGDVIVGGGVQYDRGDIDLDGATDVEGILRVGPRVGYDLNRNWIYGTAGYAKAYTDGGGVGDSDGWFGGVGYEVFLTDNVTAGAEVLYHKFSDFDASDLEADATTANISVNYRF
ncbi:outer membrane protein [Roseivivax isoporae]|uniref:Membrane protein n=1 Tax=Roseivivax isoporae LMG 25204 TaxID=1449351 RepID=X7F8H8_9RHOB|nr:outer membrane beta-barrel protein [Roseivivax isoporae]ETX28406.1 membrane protein [Roseivivax isoporae LMG 25204]